MASPPERHASPAGPDPGRPSVIDREALEYLGREIRPVLRRGERRGLARAISTAVTAGSVGELGRLGERQRRELLETIENRLSRGRRAPSPRALVRLTSVIAAAPDPNEPRARSIASPAR